MDLYWAAYANWNKTCPAREEFNKSIIANTMVTWEEKDADDIESI
jgi:hypothetical protein